MAATGGAGAADQAEGTDRTCRDADVATEGTEEGGGGNLRRLTPARQEDHRDSWGLQIVRRPESPQKLYSCIATGRVRRHHRPERFGEDHAARYHHRTGDPRQWPGR